MVNFIMRLIPYKCPCGGETVINTHIYAYCILKLAIYLLEQIPFYLFILYVIVRNHANRTQNKRTVVMAPSFFFFYQQRRKVYTVIIQYVSMKGSFNAKS
jgi:hypothetical protein